MPQALGQNYMREDYASGALNLFSGTKHLLHSIPVWATFITKYLLD